MKITWWGFFTLLSMIAVFAATYFIAGEFIITDIRLGGQYIDELLPFRIEKTDIQWAISLFVFFKCLCISSIICCSKHVKINIIL